jgi:hypothetical protein
LYSQRNLAESVVNNTKSNTYRQGQTAQPGLANAATINASKSNTYKQGSPKGTGGPAGATTINSTKSNTY